MIKVFFIFFSFFPLFSVYAYDLNTPEKIPLSKLTLSSQGTISKPADELQINIGIVTVQDTAEKGLTENSRKMQDVIKALKSAGLNQDDFETGHFAITPTYTPYPKDPTPDWKPSINGYEVNNTIFIHTSAIDAAGELIDAANQAGANSINSIRFVLQDPNMYWKEAIASATTNAINEAKVVANAADLRLGRILSIILENNNAITPKVNFMLASKMMNEDSNPPILSGNIILTAHITLTYEIEPIGDSY